MIKEKGKFKKEITDTPMTHRMTCQLEYQMQC
jgi:hypothetical protein